MLKLCVPIGVVVIAGCASPPEVKQTISNQRLAGYWQKPSSKEEFLEIKCDGSIKYLIHKDAFVGSKIDKENGNIKSITDGRISYSSPKWFGLKFAESYSLPAQDKDGCWRMSFKGRSFRADQPIDCSLPERSLIQIVSDASKERQNRCYEEYKL